MPTTEVEVEENVFDENNENSKSQKNVRKSREQENYANERLIIKWIRTVLLICTWISQGLFMELAGPTLKDLIVITGSNYEGIADAVSAQGAGVFIGCIVAGFLVDRFERHLNLILAGFLTGCAFTIMSIPWVVNLKALWVMYLVLGTCHGSVNLAGQRQVLLIWGKDSASPMNLVHLGYGIGAFIAPLLSNPFLANIPITQIPANSSNVTNVTSMTVTNASHNEVVESESRVHYAYLIVGIITILLSTVFYVQQIIQCRQKDSLTDEHISKSRVFKKMINPATCADGNFCFGITILILLFIRYIWLAGWDRTSGTFLRSYAIDQLNFSKDAASYLNTAFWACYAGGRFLGFIIARFVPVKYLLLAETSLGTLISVLLLLFGREYTDAMWVLTVLMGVSLGPLYPTGVAWGNNAIEITGLAIAVLQFGTSSGALIFIKAGGMMYNDYGPTSFIYTLFVIGIGVMINDVLLTLVFAKRGRFFKTTETDIGS